MLLPTNPSARTPVPARRDGDGLARPVMVTLVVLACLAFVLEFGLRLPPWLLTWLHWVELGLAAGFATDLLLVWRRAPVKRVLLHARWYEYAVLAVWVVGLAVVCVNGLARGNLLAPLETEFNVRSVADLGIIWCNFFLLLIVVLRFLRMQELLLARIRPELLLCGSFLFLILLGAFLLRMPRMGHAQAPPISNLDALFTATSAVCVTGLSVRDTGTAFSNTGQAVILLLIQTGGLGIITFVAILALASARRFSLPQVAALREIVRVDSATELRRQVVAIFGFAFLLEAVGALLLYVFLPAGDHSLLWRLKWCVFHAVSAFCNAGIGLDPDSLSGYRQNWGLNLTVAGLIVFGGLGFLVLRDLLEFRWRAASWCRGWRCFRRQTLGQSLPRLRLDTKLAVLVTALLIGLGTAGILLFEEGGVLAGMSWADRLLAAIFQSVTARTAGFNTLPIGQLQNATILLLVVLMAIGASPASTGGGMKTTTFAIMLLTLRAVLRGGERVQAFGRAVSRTAVQVSVAICTLYVMAAVLVTLLLAVTNPGIPLRDLTFEAVSALSTVGLSIGVTAQLNDTGKLVLCLAMFAGRVGPLSAAMLMVAPSRQGRHSRFPDEGIVVG